MRYLYGDSVPFPPQYDFLATLEVFCTQAARVVRADDESRAARASAEVEASRRLADVEALEAFHKVAVDALREGAGETSQVLVQDYLRQVIDLATGLTEEARHKALQTSEREANQVRAESERRRAEIRDALEKLLVAMRVPAVETHLTMKLEDGRNAFSASFMHEGGLVGTFALAGDEVEDWKVPRQIRELAKEVALPVGVKRSLFKRTVATEVISLDEHVIGGFDLRDDGAELRLRRRAEQVDTLTFTLDRLDGRLAAEVHYPTDAEAESGLPAKLDAASAEELDRLLQLLRVACAPVLARKKRLVRLTLGGEDVFANDLGAQVVAHLVGVLAPVIGEVARRSPNQEELSLKVEGDTGRREEIYLRKAELVAALSSVPSRARGVFAPLGLLPPSLRDSAESLPDDAILPG